MTLTIGAVAKHAEVGIQTLRYYERRGLLSRAARTQAGYRLFPDDEPRRVRFIRRAQSLGFTLKEIRALLELRVKDPRRCERVLEFTSHTLERVRSQIDDLRRIERALRMLVRRCEAGRATPDCPMIQALETEDGAL